jgi:hypothetical protein
VVLKKGATFLCAWGDLLGLASGRGREPIGLENVDGKAASGSNPADSAEAPQVRRRMDPGGIEPPTS